jgi:hypothetical protein
MRKRLLAAGEELADATEVASFVRAIVEDKLAERRAKVEQVLRLRGEMGAILSSTLEPEVSFDASPAGSVSGPRPSSHEVRAPAVAAEVTDSVASLSPERASTRARRRWMVIAAALAVPAAALWLWRRPAAPEVAAPPGTAPAGLPDAPPVPSAEPTAAARSVTLTADGLIAQVRVGSRSITVAPPAREVVLPRTAEETGDVEVEVVAADGRLVRTSLRAESNQLGVAFGPPQAATGTAVTPPRRGPASQLAPSPYKKKP